MVFGNEILGDFRWALHLLDSPPGQCRGLVISGIMQLIKDNKATMFFICISRQVVAVFSYLRLLSLFLSL